MELRLVLSTVDRGLCGWMGPRGLSTRKPGRSSCLDCRLWDSCYPKQTKLLRGNMFLFQGDSSLILAQLYLLWLHPTTLLLPIIPLFSADCVLAFGAQSFAAFLRWYSYRLVQVPLYPTLAARSQHCNSAPSLVISSQDYQERSRISKGEPAESIYTAFLCFRSMVLPGYL